MPQVPKAFLFDIGNVLACFDFAPAARKLVAGSEAPPVDPLEAILTIKDALECGRLDEERFVADARDVLGYRGSSEDFLTIWSDIFTENKPMSQCVQALAAAGHPLFILSNTNGPHLRHLRATYDVFRHFRGGTYSHEAGSMKPGDAIYHTVITRYGLVPAETLYIDDLAANVETGERLGFLTHHYHPERHGEFESLLAGYGFVPPARE